MSACFSCDIRIAKKKKHVQYSSHHDETYSYNTNTDRIRGITTRRTLLRRRPGPSSLLITALSSSILGRFSVCHINSCAGPARDYSQVVHLFVFWDREHTIRPLYGDAVAESPPENKTWPLLFEAFCFRTYISDITSLLYLCFFFLPD
jgi:hypothetical protein